MHWWDKANRIFKGGILGRITNSLYWIVLNTLVIDAYEGQDVDPFDFLGEYLQSEASNNKTVFMKLRG